MINKVNAIILEETRLQEVSGGAGVTPEELGIIIGGMADVADFAEASDASDVVTLVSIGDVGDLDDILQATGNTVGGVLDTVATDLASTLSNAVRSIGQFFGCLSPRL